MNQQNQHKWPGTSISIDAKVFLLVAIIGAALMFSMKALQIGQLFITLTLVILVMLYTLVVVKLSRLHLRADQAGDNAYYLGLIFTILSMAFALYAVGQGISGTEGDSFSVAEIVIGDFGLALATTLIGIVCRIVLHDMHVDPGEVELAGRMALAEAASKVIAELNVMSSSFGAFVLELQQRQDDHSRTMSERHAEAIQILTDNISNASNASHQAVTESGRALNDALKGFSVSIGETAAAVEAASDRLREIEPLPTKLSRTYSTVADKVDKVSSTLQDASENLDQACKNIGTVSGAVAALVNSVAHLSISIDDQMRGYQTILTQQTDQTTSGIDQLAGVITSLSSEVGKLSESSRHAVEMVRRTENAAVDTLDKLSSVLVQTKNAISRE